MLVAGTAEALVPVLAAAAALKRLPRAGWLLAGVLPAESVADHCYATGVTALLLAGAINEVWADQGLTAPLDMGRVAQIALVHDLAESQVTDLPLVTTRLLGKQVKHAAEAAVMRGLAANSPRQVPLVALWEEYNAALTPEGRVVRDADKLEMAHQALIYERAGHQQLGEFRGGQAWHYPMSQAVWGALLAAYGKAEDAASAGANT